MVSFSFALFAFAALVCPGARATLVQRIATLHARAKAPNQAAATAFAVNHSDPVFFLLVTQAIAANKCMDLCINNNEDHCVLKRKPHPTLDFIPRWCAQGLKPISLGERGKGAVLVSAGGMGTFTMVGNRLGVCKPCLNAAFAKSQVVADLVTACQEVRTYNNASQLFYDLQLAPGVYSYSDVDMEPRLRMLLSRYPKAHRILSVMRSVRSSDFCNIFASEIMRGQVMGQDT